VRPKHTPEAASRFRPRARASRRATAAAQDAAQLAAAARAVVSAEERLSRAEKQLADRDALVYAAETIELAACDADQLRQRADEHARTIRLQAQREAAEARLAAEREVSALRLEVAQELEQLRHEVAREARRMRIRAKAMAEAGRTGVQLQLQVEEHAAKVRAEADELMRRATAAARRSPPVAHRAVARPAPTLQHAGDRRVPRRQATVAVVIASMLSIGGASLVATAGRGEVSPAGASSGAVGAAAGWSPQQLDLVALQRRLAPAPEKQGPSGAAMLGALRQLETLSDARRRNRALGLANDIEVAVRNGLLAPEAERLVRPVLLDEIVPPDLPGLIEMLEVRPLGAGPAGGQILNDLRALPAQPTAAQRRAALQRVRDLADEGRLTSAFRHAADRVLR
jgi:hypothetical protein